MAAINLRNPFHPAVVLSHFPHPKLRTWRFFINVVQKVAFFDIVSKKRNWFLYQGNAQSCTMDQLKAQFCDKKSH